MDITTKVVGYICLYMQIPRMTRAVHSNKSMSMILPMLNEVGCMYLKVSPYNYTVSLVHLRCSDTRPKT